MPSIVLPDRTERRMLRVMIVALILAVAAMVFITPPFQGPDEPQHFSRAYQISLGHLLCRHQNGVMGDVLPQAITDLPARDFPLVPRGSRTIFHPDRLVAAWHERLDPDDTAFVPFPNVASYAPTLYAPQALGIAIGRAAGLPPIGMFYLARLCNALVGIGLVIAALRVAPFGGAVFAAVAALPTTLYQTATVSPDATIIGLGFLLIAIALRGIRPEPVRPAIDRLALPIVAILTALAKAIYLPVSLAGLPDLLARRDRRLPVLAASVFAGLAAFVAWTLFSGGTQLPFNVVSRTTQQMVWTAVPGDQIRVVLAHPIVFARVLATSFAERLPVYLLQIVGRFGWNAVLMPGIVYVLALAACGLALLTGGGFRPRMMHRLWWLALMMLGAVLIETALYVTGTPLAADYIQGTQGRYFLPYLPLLGLAFWAVPARPPRIAWMALPVILLLPIAAVLVDLDSFWIGGFTETGGFPLFQHTMAGLLRVALLPSGRW